MKLINSFLLFILFISCLPVVNAQSQKIKKRKFKEISNAVGLETESVTYRTSDGRDVFFDSRCYENVESAKKILNERLEHLRDKITETTILRTTPAGNNVERVLFGSQPVVEKQMPVQIIVIIDECINSIFASDTRLALEFELWSKSRMKL